MHDIHLTFVYSFLGFRDSLTFQHVDDAQINKVENFIKTKLPAVLTNLKSRENAEPINDEDFFGPVHVFDPLQFDFSPGDRLQIMNVAKYVKEKLSDTNAGARYFDPNKSKTVRPNYECVGQHFHHTPLAQINQNVDAHNPGWKNRLYEHAVKVMTKKGVNVKKVQQFTDSMVSITTNNGTEGHIQCVLCKNTDGKHDSITVQSKMGDKSKLYWNLSNFGKHLNKHLQKGGRTSEQLIDDEKENASLDGNDDETHDHQIDNVIEDENKVEHDVTTHLKIEPIDVNSLELLIYNQISDQLIKMKNAAMTHNESQSEMIFLNGNVRHTLQKVKIDPDGSCLFGATIHQTLGTEIGSTTQTNETKKLRADVVDHIKNNRSDFKRELEGVVLDIWENEAKSNIELACTRFLQHELPKNETWGGAESLKAITQLKKVNILVVNENGDFYFSRQFNAQFKQTIILAYTTYDFEEHEVSDFENGTANVSNVSNIKRIHYDSVINIEQKDVFSASKVLALKTYQQMMDKGKTISMNVTL